MKKTISIFLSILLFISITLIFIIKIFRDEINYLEFINFKYNGQYEEISSYKEILNSGKYDSTIEKYTNVLNDFINSNNDTIDINKQELINDINLLIDEYELKTGEKVNRNNLESTVDSALIKISEEVYKYKNNKFIGTIIYILFNRNVYYGLILTNFISIILIICINKLRSIFKYLGISLLLSSLTLIIMGIGYNLFF